MNSENITGFFRTNKKRKREIMFHGIPASPGIVIGTLLLLEGRSIELLSGMSQHPINEKNVTAEIERFRTALKETSSEIEQLRDRVQQSLRKNEANVFDAHFLIVQDRMLMTEVCSTIEKKLQPAEYAFSQVMQKYMAAISSVSDPYLKERAIDIKDVASRVLAHLQGLSKPPLDHLPGPRVITANDLPPSETVGIDREHLLGFAIESGSKTCHTAIIARSMKIPAIVGLNHFVDCVEDGDHVILDGFLGIVILNPTSATLELYREKARNTEKLYAQLQRESQLSSETTDGYLIKLSANVENLDAVADLKQYGASGVGLFRTEYLFLNKEHLPSEEEQYEVYSQTAKAADGAPVIIRTLDVGGDKLAKSINAGHEQNPFLGRRAIRLCLERPDLFKDQLRAILRAGVHGNVKIMFPMISSIQDLERVMDVLEDAKNELREAKIPFDEKMEIGTMIEIPSAAIIADTLAKKVDFFSIGTNDLVQYTLAVDRINERVASYYQPTHPAVLQLISMTAKAGRRNGIWTGVCGEMAGDLRYIPLLIGLGVEELSMSPITLGYVRRLIRKLSMKDAEAIAEKALHAESPDEALQYSVEYLEKNMPEILASMQEG